MLFILGLLVGLTIAIFIVLVILFFRRPIESEVVRIEKKVSRAAPRRQGMIIEPDSEADQAREEIIEKNRSMGRSTKIEELLD